MRNFSEVLEIYGRYQVDLAVDTIGEYIRKKNPGCYVFYTNQRFSILSDQKLDFHNIEKYLSERFNKPWTNPEAKVYLTISQFGVHNYTNYENGQELVQSLKTILDSREHSLENLPIEITEEEFAIIDRSLKVKKMLTRDVKNNLEEMFLQPVISSQSGKIEGAESLVRIRDEEGNLIFPDEFIQLAEKNGMIGDLGIRIYDKACAFLSKYQTKLNLQWINVNLSPIQCMDEDLPSCFEIITKKYHLDPSKIHLEITEESEVDPKRLQDFMHIMTEKGFSFSLNDYGSGYSNINRIMSLPFKNIKIDKGIVWDYFKNPDDVLPNFIKTFKGKGYTVTAEGVENENMVNTLKSFGVDYFQGSYYSKPISEKEFIEKYQ